MRSILTCCCGMAVLASPGFAQMSVQPVTLPTPVMVEGGPLVPKQVARTRVALVQVNPLGVLQFGPNLEFQIAPANHIAVTGGLRIPTAGLVSHLLANAENDKLRFSWTIGGNLLYYLQSERFRGWFFGPRFEWGKADTQLGTTTFIVPMGEFGYRWLKPSGFTMSLGVQGGLLIDDFIGDDPIDSNKDQRTFAMGVFTLGVAF